MTKVFHLYFMLFVCLVCLTGQFTCWEKVFLNSFLRHAVQAWVKGTMLEQNVILKRNKGKHGSSKD